MWGWKMGEDLCVEFIIGYFFNDFPILHQLSQSPQRRDASRLLFSTGFFSTSGHKFHTAFFRTKYVIF